MDNFTNHNIDVTDPDYAVSIVYKQETELRPSHHMIILI